MNYPISHLLTGTALAMLIAAGCAASDGAASDAATPADDETSAATIELLGEGSGIRLVSAEDGAAIQLDAPEDLVILDVRTPEEFTDGHLDGAVMLDFYDDDFAAQLAELDPDVPYLLYCRSGNRSGQTAALMQELGFTDVADIDGGIISWADAGLLTVTQ